MNIDTKLLDLSASLFSVSLMPEVKMNLNEAKLIYEKTSLRPLIDLLHNDLDLLTSDFIRQKLLDQLPEGLVNNLISKIEHVRNIEYRKDGIELIRESKQQFKKLCYKAAHDYIATKYKDPEAIMIAMKDYSYVNLFDSSFKITPIQDLDVTTYTEMYLNNPIESSFDVINSSFATGKGYLRRSLVAVCGAPKRGKSLFLMQEATHFARTGLKVHYLALGDLNELDFIARMSAQVTKTSLREVYLNVKNYRDQMVNLMNFSQGGCVDLTVVPAMRLSVSDYAGYALHALAKYDVLIIDYDYNFKNEVESMYERGKYVFDVLGDVKTYHNQLVLVATQPSKGYCNESMLNDTCLGESSQKQMILDALITIGAPSGYACGYINVPLQRRGLGLWAPYIRTDDGRFNQVSEDLYNSFAQGVPKVPSSKEVTMMKIALKEKGYTE